MERRHLPHVTGDLRSHIVTVPEEIWKCSGIVILGRRIKSLVFTTDIAIIRNCNADAVLAVYPFTPQQVISNSIIQASNIPVLCGVGGGLLSLADGQMGIGIYGPALDIKGNSIAGEQMLRFLSSQLHLHMFDSSRFAVDPKTML